ncbi:hypothetical protein HF325_002208 [Metschnikowia pulcherrima]|uniref:Uncharacterized protein n=1 Tax=Metschnikowia pulcherrima TaxID=27326 RepID=A0A8H7GWE7_9ASCO|nr:hypothetical protein HF325_002208 [Metschnikowia pulcherrima]
MNYIPLGHNTPTVVSSSYTSSNSFTPSYLSGQLYMNEAHPQPQYQHQPIGLTGSYKTPSGPTTNISMDSANLHTPIHRNMPNRSSISSGSTNFGRAPAGTFVQSLPNSFAESSSITGHSSQQTLHRMPSGKSVLHHQSTPTPSDNHAPPNQYQPIAPGEVSNTLNNQTGSFLTGPDHYMSYKEFLQTLNQRDSGNREGDESGYEEHLNIVEFPVDELIKMLACLLTKIIEANDKLHPNHFDATIAARQKQKEHRKIRKMEREQQYDQRHESTSYSGSGDDAPGDPEQIFVMDSFNIHRLIILGITVSSKFFSDIFYKNLRYAKVGGLPLEELNYLELQFLLLLDFKLMISVEDLQNYGDLLLKFWKREQLASELVNRDGATPEGALQSHDSER